MQCLYIKLKCPYAVIKLNLIAILRPDFVSIIWIKMPVLMFKYDSWFKAPGSTKVSQASSEGSDLLSCQKETKTKGG